MKAHERIGILFQADMVRAILAGRKTLTSRLRGLGKLNDGYYRDRINKVECRDGTWCFWEHGHGSSAYPVFTAKSPYGQVDDVLVGRETFSYGRCTKQLITYTKFRKTKWGYEPVIYRAQGIINDSEFKWKPSIHMPYELSRLLLPVVRVWPSRLQDMTEEMAIQEGIQSFPLHASSGTTLLWGVSCDQSEHGSTAKVGYEILWDRINAKPRGKNPVHPWSSNPWVWRIQFQFSK